MPVSALRVADTRRTLADTFLTGIGSFAYCAVAQSAAE